MAFFVLETYIHLLFKPHDNSLLQMGKLKLRELSNLLSYHNCKLLQLLKQQFSIRDEALPGNQVG